MVYKYGESAPIAVMVTSGCEAVTERLCVWCLEIPRSSVNMMGDWAGCNLSQLLHVISHPSLVAFTCQRDAWQKAYLSFRPLLLYPIIIFDLLLLKASSFIMCRRVKQRIQMGWHLSSEVSTLIGGRDHCSVPVHLRLPGSQNWWAYAYAYTLLIGIPIMDLLYHFGNLLQLSYYETMFRTITALFWHLVV